MLTDPEYAPPAFPIDSMGWPKEDCQAVPFDERPVDAWHPPPDDPEKRQPKEYGVFKLSLTGAATITPGACAVEVSNVQYNAKTNTLTADLTLPKGKPDLMVLKFTQTRREPGGKNNTGFTDLVITYPGYQHDTTQLITTDAENALKPFNHMRFMGYLGTNYLPWEGKTVASSIIEWTDRPVPGMAMYGNRAVCRGCNGKPWEWIVDIANKLNKDIWINVPVSASGPYFRGPHTPKDASQTYIWQLAELFKNGNNYTGNKGLNSHLNIYIEHSNEVWNFGFGQYGYNKKAAEDQVQTNPNCPLNNTKVPGVKLNGQTWATRRHLQALYNITQVFHNVFGANSNRIRPIYAWWFAGFSLGVPAMNETLQWFEATYNKKAGDVFYGLSAAHYFGSECKTGGIQECLTDYRTASNANRKLTMQTAAVARQFGLKYTAYEAGPGWKVGDKTNMANHIQANRAPGMADLVKLDIQKNFWDIGGDVYNYFSLSSAYSHYGCWGLTDDLADLTTVKYKAVQEVIGGHTEL
eukprot:TRINITY_DN21256_c0_g1_i1.p1 TRINITY_DN21256_c0_g1~~TRINITY_DN21256_c0_g1_i1.p1  ORF type:complete len:585 (-),score=77.73 TRINITY_DN21256_c0_g1_i1:183-1751(-)